MYKSATITFATATAVALTVCLAGVKNTRADLVVNGTANGTWANNATMTYTSAPNDPTNVSTSQTELTGGGSLTVSSGTLNLTSSTWGSYNGQNTTGGVNNYYTQSGGTVNWTAKGSNEQIFNIGNHGSLGDFNISGGALNVTTDQVIIARDNTVTGTDGQLTLTGGTVTFTTAQFGMGGVFSSNGGTSNTWTAQNGMTGEITFGSGSGELLVTGLNSLTNSNTFNVNTADAYINFLTGSGGQFEVSAANAAAPLSFFQGLVTSRAIKLNGSAATISDFAYSTSGNNGVFQLAAPVPEPASLGLVAAGGLGLLACRMRRRMIC